MIIHFFKKRISECLSYTELLDEYFCSIPNCTMTSNEALVDISIVEPSFDFTYHYFVTNRTRVVNMYRLSSDYINTNILIEIPPLLPNFLIRRMLTSVSDLCKRFDLYIYHDYVKDVTEFDMLDLLSVIAREQHDYIINNPKKYYFMEREKLMTACSYLHIMKDISEVMTVDAMILPYDVLYDKENEKVALSVTWQVGSPTVFPPVLDYVYVEEEGNLLSVIPADIFFKYSKKLMHEIAKDKTINYEVDMDLFYLNEKNALRAKKQVKKMRKSMLSTSQFMAIKIIDVLEK